MSITKAQADAFILESLGGAPESLSYVQIINMAGATLVNMREWIWCRKTNVALNLVEDQAYIDLPSDVLTVDAIDSNTRHQTVQFVTRDQFLRWSRGDYGSTPPGFIATVGAETVSDVVLMRLHIYPTPAANVAGAINFSYTAQWASIADDADDADVLELPAFLEPLFFEVLLAVAKGAEKHDMANLTPRIAQIKAGTIFADAERIDAMIQPVLGTIPVKNIGIRSNQNSTRLY